MGLSLAIHGLKLHAVGMEGQDEVGQPHKFGALLAQHGIDGPVGQVALTRGGKATIESYLEARSIGMIGEVSFGGMERAHGMTARRALANAVEFF